MSLLIDLRYALRRFAATPGFVAVAAITLALGIGATTAIYSVVDALMLRPLPYADPDRLVNLGVTTQTGRRSAYFNRAQLAALELRTDLFAGVGGFEYRSGTVVSEGEPTLDGGLAVSGGLMRLLGVAAQIGRLIDESDVRPGSTPVIVLSDATWRERFAADPGIIGRTISLDGQSLEIIGVMPRSFRFPDNRRRFWVPLAPAGAPGPPPQVVARARSDQTIEEARARIETTPVTLSSADGSPATGRLQVVPSRRLNPPVRTAILVLAGAVSLVLLIACANIANLLLVQNAGREREVAVRVALGATRPRLLRQFLTEAVLLMCVGGALGLLVAQWAIDLLAAMTPENMTFLSVHDISLDGRILLFGAALTALTGVLFGLLPALKGSRLVPFDALKSGARTATSGARQERTRRAFVVMQLAVSCVLLVGASLLTRTFVRLLQVDPGFEAGRLAMIKLELPRWKYPTGQDRFRFYNDLLGRVRALPGVSAAAASGGAPPDGGGISFGLTFEVEGRGVVLNDPALVVPQSSVPPEYFSVMGIPLKAGRTFSPDDGPGAPPSIIISEQLAARLWPDENPVGRRFRMGTSPKDLWYTVIGVVGNVYQFDYAQTRGQLAFYLPAAGASAPPVQTIVVRTTGDPATVVAALRQQVRGVDPAQPIWKLGTVESEYQEFFAVPRFYTFLMSTFAMIGVAIAAVGLYGVIAYAIAQRTREFGIRLALGASSRDVLRLVLRSGGVLIAAGIVLGAAGSLLVTRALASLLVDVPRTDPITYAAVSGSLVGVALAACWIPARRATRIDPIVALRSE